MTLQDILKKSSEYLKQRNVEDPSREAGLLLSWVLGKSISFLYAHQDMVIDDEQAKQFFSAVERRGNHEPFAYITGECEFMSLTFGVNPHVLIPRADTEILAEAGLAALGKNPLLLQNQVMFKLPVKESYRALDVGTGSGCIAVSITKNVSNLKTDAVDISKDALKTAEQNAVRHQVDNRMNFIHADFLSGKTSFSEKYDLILSNPPYIPSKDIPGLMASVRDYEPHTALVGGDDGLVFYRALASKADELLSEKGIIAVECGFDQALQVQDLFLEKSMETLLLKDLSGINRVVVARKP